jgi:hypothetical protein
MSFIVMPLPFPLSPLATPYDTEEEANAIAQSMVEKAPQQTVYVAELRTQFRGTVTVTSASAAIQPETFTRQ